MDSFLGLLGLGIILFLVISVIFILILPVINPKKKMIVTRKKIPLGVLKKSKPIATSINMANVLGPTKDLKDEFIVVVDNINFNDDGDLLKEGKNDQFSSSEPSNEENSNEENSYQETPDEDVIGENFQEEIFDELYTANMEIPEELKIPIQQYLIFFNEFVKTAKGKEVNLRVEKNKKGLTLESRLSEDVTEVELKLWFEEYFGFFKNSVLDKEPPIIKVENLERSNVEIDLLNLKLRNEVSHLKNTIDILKLKNEYLLQDNNFLKELSLSTSKKKIVVKAEIIHEKNQTSIPIDATDKIKLNSPVKLNYIHDLICEGNLEEAMDQLINLTSSDQKRNEIITLKSKLSKYKKDELMNLISFEESQLTYSKILNYLILLSNQIEKRRAG